MKGILMGRSKNKRPLTLKRASNSYSRKLLKYCSSRRYNIEWCSDYRSRYNIKWCSEYYGRYTGARTLISISEYVPQLISIASRSFDIDIDDDDDDFSISQKQLLLMLKRRHRYG